MNWSLRLGKLFGIPVRVHWSMLLLVLFLSWGGGVIGVVGSLVAIALLFASVVAHELAHALAARRYGIGTAEILLMPIGGVAKIEREPARGRHEVVIALAGPAMSLLLAGLAGLLALATAGVPIVHALAATLASANLMLGLFNLLPAFPMDGGRVLRGALRERRGLLAATRVAAKVGRIVAVPMAVAGLALGSFSLVLVAGFVWLAGRSEERVVEARAAWQQEVPFEAAARHEPLEAVDATPFVVDGDAGWVAPRSAPGPKGAPRAYAVRRGGRRYVVLVGPFGYVIREV
ncbi:MAG: site-2 protease family protein [Polyangiaceae bacterium]|nr:site-2 protease family protein [Polyangiaceae bacterium]